MYGGCRGSYSGSCALCVFLGPTLQLPRNWASGPHHSSISAEVLEGSVPSKCDRRLGQPGGARPRHPLPCRHQLLPTARVEPWHTATRSRAYSRPENFGVGEVIHAFSGRQKGFQRRPVGTQLRTLYGEARQRWGFDRQ